MVSYFDILGLDSTATINEIKISYRKLSIAFHPDKGGSVYLMKLINLAKNKALAGCGTDQFENNNVDSSAKYEYLVSSYIKQLENLKNQLESNKLEFKEELDKLNLELHKARSQTKQAQENKSSLTFPPFRVFITVILCFYLIVYAYSVFSTDEVTIDPAEHQLLKIELEALKEQNHFLIYGEVKGNDSLNAPTSAKN